MSEHTNILFFGEREKVIHTLPLIDGASMVGGTLEAPDGLRAAGKVIEHTGYHFSRDHVIRPTIRTEHSRLEQRASMDAVIAHNYSQTAEGLQALVMHAKLPGFLKFEEACVNGQPLGFDEMLTIITYYVGLGYTGILHIYQGRLSGGEDGIDAHIMLALGGMREQPKPAHPYSVGISSYTPAGKRYVRAPLEYCMRELHQAVPVH